MNKVAVFLLAAAFSLVGAYGESRIVKQDGTVMEGEVTGVSGGQVQVKLAAGNIGLPLAQVKRVEMDPPREIEEARAAAPARVVTLLEPLVRAYQGLPADWVVEAMVLVGNAYAAQNDFDKAAAAFAQIRQLYGEGSYSLEANVGQARIALQQKKPDEAVALLKPILDKARASIAHTPAEGRLYADAFLLDGQALEAKGDGPGALEAYLSAPLFDPAPASVRLAEGKAATLRASRPDLKVP